MDHKKMSQSEQTLELTYKSYDNERLIVSGDRSRYSNLMRSVGGRWQSRVKKGYEPGWLISKTRERDLKQLLESIQGKSRLSEMQEHARSRKHQKRYHRAVSGDEASDEELTPQLSINPKLQETVNEYLEKPSNEHIQETIQRIHERDGTNDSTNDGSDGSDGSDGREKDNNHDGNELEEFESGGSSDDDFPNPDETYQSLREEPIHHSTGSGSGGGSRRNVTLLDQDENHKRSRGRGGRQYTSRHRYTPERVPQRHRYRSPSYSPSPPPVPRHRRRYHDEIYQEDPRSTRRNRRSSNSSSRYDDVPATASSGSGELQYPSRRSHRSSGGYQRSPSPSLSPELAPVRRRSSKTSSSQRSQSNELEEIEEQMRELQHRMRRISSRR